MKEGLKKNLGKSLRKNSGSFWGIFAKEIKTFWKATWKYFLVMAGILAVVFFAIFRANFLYIDDMDRAMDGYRGWGGFSRYTSEILSIFVHTNLRLGDISPFPQLIAVAIIALACAVLLYVFKVKIYKQKIGAVDVVAVLILAISPYFLQCMSYKFDAPYMALAVLVSVVPFLFWKSSRKVFLVLTFVGGTLMCTTYQAAAGVFPMVLIMVIFAELFRGEKLKKILKEAALAGLTYVLSLFLFSQILMMPVPKDSYVSNTMLPIGELATGALSHLAEYYRLVVSDFQMLWLLLAGAVVLSFLTLVLIKSRRKSKLGMTTFALVSMVLVFGLAFGVYPCFEKISVDPRSMLGVGVALAIVALQVSSLMRCRVEEKIAIMKPAKVSKLTTVVAATKDKNKMRWARIIPAVPIVVLAYCFATFAFLYGNALSVQQKWTEFNAAMIVDDLKDLAVIKSGEKVELRLGGTIGHAQTVENYAVATGTNVLFRLVPVPLVENYVWGVSYLRRYGLDNVYFQIGYEPEMTRDYKKEVDNRYHEIYAKSAKDAEPAQVVVLLK